MIRPTQMRAQLTVRYPSSKHVRSSRHVRERRPGKYIPGEEKRWHVLRRGGELVSRLSGLFWGPLEMGGSGIGYR